MRKLIIAVSVLGAVVLSSCSKNLAQANSTKSKTIMIVGDVKVEEKDGVKYAYFISENGTKYHVDLSKYSFELPSKAKAENLNSVPNTNISLK